MPFDCLRSFSALWFFFFLFFLFLFLESGELSSREPCIRLPSAGGMLLPLVSGLGASLCFFLPLLANLFCQRPTERCDAWTSKASVSATFCPAFRRFGLFFPRSSLFSPPLFASRERIVSILIEFSFRGAEALKLEGDYFVLLRHGDSREARLRFSRASEARQFSEQLGDRLRILEDAEMPGPDAETEGGGKPTIRYKTMGKIDD